MGTTWGTVSSVGVALTVIGQSMGFPLPLTAGAVVSGAFAGATVSPISPMAHLAATVSEVDFTDHVRNIFIHSLPALVICILCFVFLGRPYARLGADPAGSLLISQVLESTYNLSPVLFLPTILVIGLGFAGWKVVPSLMAGTITGGLVAVIYQGAKVAEVLQAMYGGYLPPNFALDFWTNKGGMVSMYDVLALIIIALSFAGTLSGTGMLQVIMEGALNKFKGQRGLMGLSVVVGSLIGLVAGTQSLVILLTGHTFMESYRNLQIPPLNLSRVLSDCGILVAPLVPWNSNGLFISGVLGVSTFTYAPYAIYCWLVPVLSFIYALRGRSADRGARSAKGRGAVNKERTTYLLMAATALLWGAGFVASKVVAANLPLFTSLVLRFSFGLAILGPMAWFTERGGFIPPRERLPALAFLGLSGLAANNGFLLLGLKTAPASVGSLIVGANPMAIALLAHLFLKERLVFRQWLGIPISFTGVLLVLWHGARELGAVGWRNLFFLASVLSWAVYSVAGRRVMRDISPLIATLWATFFGFLWCLPFVPLEGGPGLALIPWKLGWASPISAFYHRVFVSSCGTTASISSALAERGSSSTSFPSRRCFPAGSSWGAADAYASTRCCSSDHRGDGDQLPRGGDSAGEKRGRPLSRPLTILVGDHRVGQSTELFDFDGDRVPILQEDRRFAGKAHP